MTYVKYIHLSEIINAICDKKPKLTILGEQIYENLIWQDDIIPKPTFEEIENKFEELKKALPMELLRERRDELLNECSWIIQKAISTNRDVPEEWKLYMQQLRDLPTTSNPSIIEIRKNTFILDKNSVQWPIKPAPWNN